MSGTLWRGGLVLVGIVLAWIVLDRSSIRDQMAERRSIETRAAELTVRAMAPGSALACLDAVAGATIETACEKALFASPEAVAAAVAYVDARLSLLASSLAVGQRDAAMRPSIERLRRAIEGDRFGLVAHVLMTRGCTSTDCPDLKLVRDTSRIMSNMRSRAFDAYVNVHALAWHPGAVTVNTVTGAASAPAQAPVVVPQGQPAMAHPPAMQMQPSVSTMQPPPFIPQQQPVAAAPAMPEQPAASGGAATAHPPAPPAKYDYPSSASIPAVSIMAPEPAGPPAAEAKPAPTRRPAQNQQQRASSSREPAPRQAAPPPAPPQTSGAR